jgi:hypothetical protein
MEYSADSEVRQIPTVRLLGVTWASRGLRYWNRRFWIALCYALIPFSEVVIIVGAWSGLAQSAATATTKLAVSAVLVVMICGGFIWAFRTLWKIGSAEYRHDIPRLRAIREKEQGLDRDRRRGGVAGLALGAGGLAGIPAALLSIAVGAFATVGWGFVILIMGLMPYLSVEEYLAMHDLKKSAS